MESLIRVLKKNDQSDLEKVFSSWSESERKEKCIFHSFAEVQRELERGHLLGIFFEQNLVGFMMVSFGSVFEILLILIKKEEEGQGFGQALFQALSQKAFLEQVPEIWLEVAPENSRALQFYLQLGFQIQGRRPQYYRNGSDALNLSYKVL